MITLLFTLFGLACTLALDPMTDSLEFAVVMTAQMVISTGVTVVALYTRFQPRDEAEATK